MDREALIAAYVAGTVARAAELHDRSYVARREWLATYSPSAMQDPNTGIDHGHRRALERAARVVATESMMWCDMRAVVYTTAEEAVLARSAGTILRATSDGLRPLNQQERAEEMARSPYSYPITHYSLLQR